MKKERLYYIFITLMLSCIWSSEPDGKSINLKGNTEINLLSSNIYQTELEVIIEDHAIIPISNAEGYKVFIDKGSSILESGSPDLPKVTTSLIVPDDIVMEINITESNYEDYSGGVLSLGIVYFSIQIYSDFCGYSLIAIGVAKCMGFELMINFNTPYFSTSIQDFWRRWHISLSSFFKDYFYILLKPYTFLPF